MKTSRLASLTAILMVTGVQMAFAEDMNPSAVHEATRQQVQTRDMTQETLSESGDQMQQRMQKMTPQERQAMGMERNREIKEVDNAKGKTHREMHRNEYGGGYYSRGDGSQGSSGYGGGGRRGGGGGGRGR